MLPPIEEQLEISGEVDSQYSILEHLFNDLGRKLSESEMLRSAVLSHTFTGQLVPQDAADEPASELLKRIADERATRADKTRHVKTRTPAKRRKEMQLA